ncbi:MAG: Lrp/AsnC family transcriptional regulator [Myxococcota bacterium]
MVQIDEIDERILRELERDGRLSNVRLAEAVSLSPSACLRRVQQLERSGVITGYRAQVAPRARGVSMTAYVLVGLSRHTQSEQAAFEQAMAKAPEVRECHNITGAYEYLLRVESAGLEAYKHFHTNVLGALPQLSTIATYIVMDSPKDQRS